MAALSSQSSRALGSECSSRSSSEAGADYDQHASMLLQTPSLALCPPPPPSLSEADTLLMGESQFAYSHFVYFSLVLFPFRLLVRYPEAEIDSMSTQKKTRAVSVLEIE